MTEHAVSATSRVDGAPGREFTLVDDVVITGEPRQHHLLDHQTQQPVSTLWSAYLARVRSVLPPGGAHPVLRRVSYALENEAFPGDPLRCGIRMTARTRRSCTLAAALWHAGDGRMVHVAELVTVFVDPTQRGGAVAIPDDFWAEVERVEGRSIPMPEG